MALEKVGYRVVTEAAAAQVKVGPGAFFGLNVTASTAGTITIYDSLSATGNVIFAKDALAKGDVVNLNFGVAVGTGLYVVCGGTATVVVLYT